MLNDIGTPPPEPTDDVPPKRVTPGVGTSGLATPGLAATGAPHVGTQDVGPTRAGAVRPPPTEPGVRPHAAIRPHGEPLEPGVHHTRVMGDATRTDAIYDMPMEDRGSPFSIGLTLIVSGIVIAVLLFVLYTVYR